MAQRDGIEAETTSNDEISISDVLVRLWRGRGIIAVVMLIAIGIGLIYLATSAFNISRPVTYFVSLKGISNGQYPNGTAFSPQDLLHPEVLREVRERFSVPQQVSIADNVFVTYDAPQSAGITRIYRERIAGRNLTQSEVQAMNEEYQRELSSAIRSALRIDVFAEGMGMDAAAGTTLAKALPEIWSEIFSTRFRIMGSTLLADAPIPSDSLDFESTANVLVANSTLSTMTDSLQILSRDNRLSFLQTDNGVSPEELLKEISNFRRTYFDVIKRNFFNAGDPVGTTYITNLRADIEELERNIEQYDRTLTELREFQRRAATPIGQDQPLQSPDMNALQIGESALSEILSLANRATLSEYIKDALQRRESAALQISSIRKEIQLATENAEVVNIRGFREQAAEQFSDLVATYRDLLSKALVRLRAQVGELYVPAAGPMVLQSRIPAQAVLTIGIAGAVGLLLGAVFVLLRASMGSRRSPQRARNA